MTEEQIEIARRLVACGQFYWTGGTLMAFRYEGEDEWMAIRLDCDGWGEGLGKDHSRMIEDSREEGGDPMVDTIPDLADDATGGVLLGMLCSADGVVCVEPQCVNPPWRTPSEPAWSVVVGIDDAGELSRYEGSTLAEACARALLAVWGAE